MDKSVTKLLSKFLATIVTAIFALATLQVAFDRFSGDIHAQENEFSGEKIVHLLQEPRHRTEHNVGGLFLLDVQVNPGDESFPHTHDQAILLTSISNGAGPGNGTVRAITDYAATPLTHKVSNAGPGLLRIIALVNDGNGVSGDTRDAPSGMSSDPQIENPWFRSYRIELAPGEATPLQTHQNPTVIVQGSAGTLHVTRTDGVTNELAAPGDWAWREGQSPFVVRNMGQTTVAVAINEGRQ
jgi:quercetin dioxygenase-like cupin family protein